GFAAMSTALPTPPSWRAPPSPPEAAPVLRIGVLDGDDIGPEIVPETVKVMSRAAALSGVEIAWTNLPIGRRALETLGTTLPPDTLPTLDGLDGWILGPIGHQAYPKTPEAINPHPIL